MNDLAFILLAAGGSTRLGSPKQVVEIDGKPLVRVIVERLLTLEPAMLIVVVGCEAKCVTEALAALPVTIVENSHWNDGIGSSVSIGVACAESRPLRGALIALCDQPFIPADHFAELCRRFESDCPDVVASEYNASRGVPAVFDRGLFPRLRTLSGDRGAKAILNDPSLRVSTIPCESATLDLDTPADLQALRSRQNG